MVTRLIPDIMLGNNVEPVLLIIINTSMGRCAICMLFTITVGVKQLLSGGFTEKSTEPHGVVGVGCCPGFGNFDVGLPRRDSRGEFV